MPVSANDIGRNPLLDLVNKSEQNGNTSQRQSKNPLLDAVVSQKKKNGSIVNGGTQETESEGISKKTISLSKEAEQDLLGITLGDNTQQPKSKVGATEVQFANIPKPKTVQEQLTDDAKRFAARKEATKKSIDIYNQTYGTKFNEDEVTNDPEKAANFFNLYKERYDKALNPDIQVGNAPTPSTKYTSLDAALNSYNEAPKANVIARNELISNGEQNLELLKNKVVDLSIDEARFKGIPKKELINNLHKRLDPKGYEKNIQAIEDRATISTLDVLTGSHPFTKDNAKDFELLNTEKAPYEFAINESLRRMAYERIGIGALQGNESLIRDGKSLEAQVRNDDDIYASYPSLNKSRIAAAISKELAAKAGQLKGTESEGLDVFNKVRGYTGLINVEAFTTDAFKKFYSNPKTRDAALEVAANPNSYLSDASYFGGVEKNVSKPFKELGLSLLDIAGVRDKMDRLADAKNEELFPEVTPELKGYVSKIKTAINTTAYLTGMMAIQVPSTAVAANIGLGAKAAHRAGTAMAFGIPSFDANLKDADNFLESDGAKAAYATIGAMINTVGGEFLELGKISKFKELQQPLLQLSEKITDKNITQGVVNELLAKAKDPYVNALVKYGNNVTKGAAVMSYFTFANGVNKMLFGGQETGKELVGNTGTAFVDGLLGMSVLGAFGARADLQKEKNTSYKATIKSLGDNADATRDLFDLAYRNGDYTRPEYNEKVQILNTIISAKSNLDIAEAGASTPLDARQRSVYVANRTAEGIIKKQLESPLLTEKQKSDYEAQLKRLETQREDILQGLTFNDNLEPLNEVFEAQKEYKKAYEDFNEGVVENDSEVLKAKQKLETAMADYSNKNKPKNEKVNEQANTESSTEKVSAGEENASKESGESGTGDNTGTGSASDGITKEPANAESREGGTGEAGTVDKRVELTQQEQTAIEGFKGAEFKGGTKNWTDVLQSETATPQEKKQALSELKEQLSDPNSEIATGEALGKSADLIYDLIDADKKGVTVPPSTVKSEEVVLVISEKITPTDIHDITKEKGVDYESKEFMDKSEELTGERHLDKMGNDQLQKVKDYILSQSKTKANVEHKEGDSQQKGSYSGEQADSTKANEGEVGKEKVAANTKKEKEGTAPKEDVVPSSENSEVISITHEATDAIARELGLPEYEQKPETKAEWDAEVDKRLAENPNAIQEMMDKYRNHGKIDKYDQRMMLKYHASLKARLNKNPTPELLKQYNEARNLSNIEGGREVAKSLVARQGEIPVDNSLTNYLSEEANANRVETLPQEKINELKDKYEADQKIVKELNARIAKLEEEAANREIGKEVTRQKKNSPKVKKTSDDFVKERKEITQSIKDKWRSAGKDILSSDIPYRQQLGAIAPDVARLVKSYVEEGIIKLSEIVSKAHSEVKEFIPEITERDIRDIIKGDYNEKKQTKNEIAAQMRDIRSQQNLLDKLESLKKGEPSKDPVKRQKRSEEIEKVLAEIKKFTDKQKEAISEAKRAEKEAEDNKKSAAKEEEKLTKEFEAETNKVKKATLESKVKEAKRISKELDKKTPEEVKLQAYKTGLKNKNLKLKQALETGDFLKEPEIKKPLKLDKEAEKLLDQHIRFVKETNIRRAKAEFESRGKAERVYDGIMQVLGIKRIVQTAIDLSIPFRQGVTLAFNPRRWMTFGKSFKSMMQSVLNPAKFDRIMYGIHTSPDYQNMLKDKVVFNEMDAVDSNSRNEDFQKSFIYKIPLIREPLLASNRAADGFLNVARYEMYMKGKSMLERQGITRENNPEHYEALGKWAMNVTGRGNLIKFLEDSHNGRVVASNTFFGARLMASRFNLLNPYYYINMPKEIRVEALKDMGTYVGMIGATLLAASAAGADVSTDIDSPDFLKIRVGDTRYDITGGMVQYVRTYLRLNRMVEQRIFEPDMPKKDKDKYAKYAVNSVFNFFRYKLAPNTSYGFSAVTGKDALGKDFNETDALKIYPMYVDDMITAYEQNGIVSLGTVLLPSMLGIGVQTYEDKKK